MKTANEVQKRLREAYAALGDTMVDPRDAYLDDEGWDWVPLSLGGSRERGQHVPTSEQELAAVRADCRALAVGNEFAINGHENRISYIVGPGYSYRAAPRPGRSVAADDVAAVQEVLDEFLEENSWHARQQEMVRRRDRDGEVFLRFFARADGRTRVRFIEPDQVCAPKPLAHDPTARFGIQTDPHDVEEVLGYYVDGEFIDASQVRHWKSNVDANVKRGLPLFYPVRRNLRRAERLLRNMCILAEIQTAIALIRKHHGHTAPGVRQFVSQQADLSGELPGRGPAVPWRRYAPGTILDADGTIEYDFPANRLNAASYVAVLQAELRAIASRLVMPEFMLTSDASNANYASTMVAEGPAMKLFTRLQAEQADIERHVMRRVLDNAVAGGWLAPSVVQACDILIEPPSLSVRDDLRDAQVYRIEHERGILSPQTWCQLRGLDYAQEQANWREHDRAGHPGS